MISAQILDDAQALAAQIPDGAMVALPPSRSGAAMAVTRALVRRGANGLHLVLVGAGQVAVVEGAGVTLDEFGQAPCFGRAVRSGSIKLKDSTCPAVISALQAGEKGIPFIPIRGLLGSDVEGYRDDYQIIDNPFAEASDPIVLLPAIVPDVALFHAPLADRLGNVWIGSCRELMVMAHAAKTAVISVEEAARRLPWTDAEARSWLRDTDLVRRPDGKHAVVVWGDVVSRVRGEPREKRRRQRGPALAPDVVRPAGRSKL